MCESSREVHVSSRKHGESAGKRIQREQKRTRANASRFELAGICLVYFFSGFKFVEEIVINSELFVWLQDCVWEGEEREEGGRGEGGEEEVRKEGSSRLWNCTVVWI